ncbi:hypothetical protein DID88_007059 [Monilinia fructigena]|uniref:Serine aminopeptidase S33 domain-containing protein n=1 Tax=Monilinia fructigena TaxID=38457 RepID=A0A395JC56_9HELO|nr:hypothetical protein DID88_007059 [Monilinia fructigena]
MLMFNLPLIALTNPRLQRHVMYVHKLHLPQTWATDIDKPEKFGFAKNQVSPFNFSTADGETLYAWHPSGFVDDISLTKGFQLLRDDPDARLIINYLWERSPRRTNKFIPSEMPDGSTSNIHILAIDYRGFGRSTGFPTEEGLITDGLAAVDWAMKVAKVPSSRIVILGQSLGTAVACGVVESSAIQGIEFAGVVLVSGFTDVSSLLTSYSIAGWIPVLSPLRSYPALQKLFISYVNDKWPSTSRLTNYVQISKRRETPLIWVMVLSFQRGKTGNDKIIRQEVVGHGAHSTVLTYAPLSLAVFKAFGLDNGGVLP